MLKILTSSSPHLVTDLEKPADSALTTQNTFMVWATVELPASESNRSGEEQEEEEEEDDWARLEMPMHMQAHTHNLPLLAF